jgi:GYF domain 2
MIANCTASTHAIASAPEQVAPSVALVETWYVATRSGTQAMTLDELDEALASGEVDTSTRLWIPGMTEWEALGSVANLEDGPPLECTPGAMLEYGLDAERALSSEAGSGRPIVGDIRDYDPFSFPPPVDDIPDPNRALWASILPPTAVSPTAVSPTAVSPTAVSTHTRARLRVEPWWRVEGRAPWIGLVLSGTFVLCLSLLGVARLLSAAPRAAPSPAATMAFALAAQAPASPPVSAPAAAFDAVSNSIQAGSGAPARVRYEEPESAHPELETRAPHAPTKSRASRRRAP